MANRKKKIKQVTFRIWKDNPRGDDSVISIRGIKATAKRAKRLQNKGRLNSIMVATGRSVLSERNLNKTEKKKFRKVFRRL